MGDTRQDRRGRTPATAKHWRRERVPEVDAEVHWRRSLYGRRSGPSLPMAERRPTDRSQCRDGPRPCPWYGCRYHLGLDVRPSGSIRYVEDLEAMADTCALDVADRGGLSLQDIGLIDGQTRERARQVLEGALKAFRRAIPPGTRDELRTALLEAFSARHSAPIEEVETIEGEAVSMEFAAQVREAHRRLLGRYVWTRRKLARPAHLSQNDTPPRSGSGAPVSPGPDHQRERDEYDGRSNVDDMAGRTDRAAGEPAASDDLASVSRSAASGE